MSHHVAPGVDAADPDAGVGALEVDAGEAGGALAVDDTLGSTVGRSSEVSWRMKYYHLALREEKHIFEQSILIGQNSQ